MKKKAKISFNAEMTADIAHLKFELKHPNLYFPDHIGGKYYFSLSQKDRKKYRLINPEYVLKHSYHNEISNLTLDLMFNYIENEQA